MNMKKKLLFKAPVLTRSGYGEQSRFALRALRSREDMFDIYIQPLQWGNTSWINEESEERRWIDQAIEKTIHYIQSSGQFDISLQVTIPNEWEKIAAVNIGYTAGIETTKVAPVWLEKGNMMDRIVVVSNHSKNTYEKTVYNAVNKQTNEEFVYKLTTPIEAVNYPVKTYEELPSLKLDLPCDFNFICMAQLGPRKNVFNTVKWFAEEFHEEEVGLVVKTNMAKNCLMDRELVKHKIASFLNINFPERKCKVYVLHGDMTDEEVHAIYQHPKIKAALMLTHGEGFGLPLFEAAYSGVPVVTTGWSGQLDFLYGEDMKENFYNVSFDLQQVPPEVVWENVLIADSMWAFPREISAKEMMRQCYVDINEVNENTHASNAANYATTLRERFSEEKMYAQFVEAMGINETDFSVENWLSSLDIEEIE
jgi:glycosyltransferase involved in cell wall biosynthesis